MHQFIMYFTKKDYGKIVLENSFIKMIKIYMHVLFTKWKQSLVGYEMMFL